MADATAFEKFGVYRVGTPTSPVPKVASSVGSTATTITSTVAFTDQDGTVIASKIRVSAKVVTGDNAGYVEVFEVPAGNISADGKTFTGVTRGIEPGGIDAAGNTSFAVALPEGTILGIAPSVGQMEAAFQVFEGTLPTGSNNFRVGDLTDSDIRYYAQNADASKPYLGYDSGTSAWVFSNDGITETALGSALTSNTSATTQTSVDLTGHDSLTSGKIADFSSNSSDATSRNLVVITNDNTAATGATCLQINQDAARVMCDLNQNGNGFVLGIETAATNQEAISIAANSMTTGSVININSTNGLTTGSILNLVSNSSDASARSLVQITNDNVLATGATALSLQQDSTNQALYIDYNGTTGVPILIDSESTSNVISIPTPQTTTGDIIDVTANQLTTGTIANFISNSSDASARSLVQITNDNTAATGALCMTMQQDAANAFVDFVGTAAATTTDPISTNTTSGATTHHIQIEINGTKAWIAASTNNPS